MHTNAEMRQMIERGGSVLYKGRIIANVAALPSDGEIAAGKKDTAGMESEAAKLELEAKQLAEKAALLRELAKAPTGPTDAGPEDDDKGKGKAKPKAGH